MIIAIGASIGGTEAIIEVIKDFPYNFPGVIIVQHMPPIFTKMYADRLNNICKGNVKEAEDFDRVKSGQILIAQGDYHLELFKDIEGYYVRSIKGEKIEGHCPSVNLMFESVSKVASKNAIGVILTGMGADGAKGITSLKKAGGFTIGQNKETSIVYGMPFKALELGGITQELPLEEIGFKIINQVKLISNS